MAQIELFERGSSYNEVTVKHAEDSYELLRHLMWSGSGRILDGLSPMHPLIKTMLREADSRETVDLYQPRCAFRGIMSPCTEKMQCIHQLQMSISLSQKL